jgi:hypothetical protein
VPDEGIFAFGIAEPAMLVRLAASGEQEQERKTTAVSWRKASQERFEMGCR